MESLPPLEVIEILDSSTEEDEDDDNNNIGVWDRGTLRDEEPKPQRIRQRNGGFVSTARCVPQINDSLIVGKQIDFETHGGPNMLTTKTELNSLNRRKDNQNDDGRSSGDADIENKHDSVHRNSATAMDEISEPVADVGMAETTSTDVTMTTFTLSSIQTKMVLQGVSSSQSEIDVNSRDSAMNRPAAVARKPGSLHKDVPRDKRPETTDLIFNEVHGGDNRGCGVLLSQQQTLQQPTCLRPRDKNASDSARYNNHGDGTGNPAAHFSLCLPILSTERTAKEAPHLPTDGESACLLLNGAATVPSVETHDLQREKRVTLTRTALNDAQIAEKSTCIPPTATNIKEAGVANMVSSIGKRNIQGGANGSSGDLRRHLSSGILPLPNSPAKEGLTGLQPAPAARCLEGQAPADGITTRTEVTCSVQQNMLLMEERERKQFERILHTTSQGQATCSISTKHQRKTAFKSTMGGSVITGRNVAPKIDKTALSSRKRSREDVGFVSQSNKRTCAIGESEIQEEPRVIAHIAAHNDNCDDPVNQRSIGGVSSSSSQTSQPVYLPAAHDSSVDGSLTSSLVNRRKQMCGECPGCIAPCCGKCVLCARRRGADTPRSSCIFRICKDHSVKTKAYRQSQVKKLFCESQPRITNEAKPIRRAFACDVTATNISFSTEESRPEVSNYENTDDTTRKTIGWWAGNGISHDRAVAFLRKISNPKRCDTCSACVTVNCGKCGMCQLGHSDACIIRCCGSAGSVTEAFYIEEINLMLGGRVNRCLCEGTKVYCRWPTNNVR